MKKIPLTKGQVAIVDDADYKWLSQWKWYAGWSRTAHTFYAYRREWRNGKKLNIAMHRQILGLEYGDPRQGDHVNHEGVDNRRANVRIVSRRQNLWNRRSAKGYSLNKASGKYVAYITMPNGKMKYLGQFNSAKEAKAARIAAEKTYYRFD